MSIHALNPLDATSLINAFGILGILAVMFLECGVIICFFLPGDSLLFVAGVAASGAAAQFHVKLSLAELVIAVPLAVILGSQLGHFTGAKLGRRLFERPDSRLFKRKYADQAELYFNKYGPAKTVVISRFIVGVRTFVNPLAGMLEMSTGQFLLWNVVSGVAWSELVILLGYFVGDRIKGNIDTWILPIAALIAVVSLVPVFLEVLKSRRESRRGPVDDGNAAPVEAYGAPPVAAGVWRPADDQQSYDGPEYGRPRRDQPVDQPGGQALSGRHRRDVR